MYKIHVLDDKEFDTLPKSATRGSNVSESLGFANKFNGNAYVRQTGVHELNKYLINHELEELSANESTHEDENGIRHKSFGKIAQWIPLISPIMWAADAVQGKDARFFGMKTKGKETKEKEAMESMGGMQAEGPQGPQGPPPPRPMPVGGALGNFSTQGPAIGSGIGQGDVASSLTRQNIPQPGIQEPDQYQRDKGYMANRIPF